MKKALISGVVSQNGSYPAEFLSNKGYEVHEIIRPDSIFATERINDLNYE